MKKLLLVFPLLFIFHFAEAQYRFYAGLRGGPNVSFSNSTTNYWTLENNPNYKIRHLKGFVAGYHFHKQKFTIEVGYNDQFHASVINFEKHRDYPDPPQLTIKHHGSAASYILKPCLIIRIQK